MQAKRTFLIAILLFIVATAVFVGTQVWTRALNSGTNPSPYQEIREYNGMKLGSINDFWNEAIAGT